MLLVRHRIVNQPSAQAAMVCFLSPSPLIPASLSAHNQLRAHRSTTTFNQPLCAANFRLFTRRRNPPSTWITPVPHCLRNSTPNCVLAEIAAITPVSLSLVQTLLTGSTLSQRFSTALLFNLPLYLLIRVRGQNWLTSDGLNHALGLGLLLWTTSGLSAYIVCFSFLVLGSLATRIGAARKQALGIAEKRGGKRGPENLWGAAGACAICAILSGLFQTEPWYSMKIARLMHVAFCGAVAAKSADTVSSEIGKAYGSNTFLVTTLKPVPPGTEGAVSTEGTIAGVIAATVLALLGIVTGLLTDGNSVLCVAAAGTFANLAESVIGERFQGEFDLTNEQVNFINTCIGAVIAGTLYLLFSSFLFS